MRRPISPERQAEIKARILAEESMSDMNRAGGVATDGCRVEQLEEQLAQAEKDAADMSAELCDLQQELDAVKLSLSETQSAWVPLSERSPEPEVDVLLADYRGNRCVGYRRKGGRGWAVPAGYLYVEPCHWMPLPEAPK